jgi:hypothetical protein
MRSHFGEKRSTRYVTFRNFFSDTFVRAPVNPSRIRECLGVDYGVWPNKNVLQD